jgi:hypothetical protein
MVCVILVLLVTKLFVPKLFTGNTPRGFINNTSWRPALDRPLLGLTVAERDSEDWGKDQFVVKVARKTVVDLIINNIEKGDHPFHMVRIAASLHCKPSEICSD